VGEEIWNQAFRPDEPLAVERTIEKYSGVVLLGILLELETGFHAGATLIG
jgi:hypothetical protein